MPGTFLILRCRGDDNSGITCLVPFLSDLSITARAPGDPLERDFSWLSQSFVTDLSADGMSILFCERSLSDSLSYEVWLRHLDGSAPVRLGPGCSYELSSDGKWALSRRESLSAPITVLPTGAGEAWVLQNDLGVLWASWVPGGQHVVLAAVGPDDDVHLYSQEIAGGPPSLISDEAVQASQVSPCRVSPDGQRVAALGADGFIKLFPLDGGESRPVPGVEQYEIPLRWSEDGRSLFVWRLSSDLPARVDRLDVETGERSLWREFTPTGPAGVRGIVSLIPTPDGRAYAYSYFRGLETLYLLSGLK